MRLEEELKYYESQLLFMLSKVRQMIQMAQEAIKTNDKEKALNIIEMDDVVNHVDEEINHRASEMLSLLQPVAKDLRAIIAGIKISTDIERIGDYAKNVGRYVIKNDALSENVINLTVKLIDQVLHQLDDLYEALKTSDVKAAYIIPDNDQKVDDAFLEAVTYIEDKIQANSKDFKYPVFLISMLRNLERAGDHVKNICESIIYKTKGQHIDFG